MKKLFDTNQELVAEDFNGYYVYENQWYYLNKNNKISLFNADRELIAENLDSCHVYESGWYSLE
jgi:hypothetical protein